MTHTILYVHASRGPRLAQETHARVTFPGTPEGARAAWALALKNRVPALAAAGNPWQDASYIALVDDMGRIAFPADEYGHAFWGPVDPTQIDYDFDPHGVESDAAHFRHLIAKADSFVWRNVGDSFIPGFPQTAPEFAV